MKVIELNRGQVAIVDDEDFAELAQYRWRVLPNGYAYRQKRYGPRKEAKQHSIYMHRVVNKTPDGFLTDHINGNKLDNRRCNLRTANDSQNACNASCRASNKLGIKGVSQKPGRPNKFQAFITLDQKCRYLGTFGSAKEAKAAYDLAALDMHKEFARLN